MAFFPIPQLPLVHHPSAHLRTPHPSPTSARRAPKMVEQSALVVIATVIAGVGGGIGLVAWTEQQGKRSQQRENVQPCAECRGETTVVCNVCNGSCKDSLDESKPCSYCEGSGSVTCFNCGGSGIQPRFLDRLSPDDFMD